MSGKTQLVIVRPKYFQAQVLSLFRCHEGISQLHVLIPHHMHASLHNLQVILTRAGQAKGKTELRRPSGPAFRNSLGYPRRACSQPSSDCQPASCATNEEVGSIVRQRYAPQLAGCKDPGACLGNPEVILQGDQCSAANCLRFAAWHRDMMQLQLQA